MSSEIERILGKSEQHGKQFLSAIVREGLQRPVNGVIELGAATSGKHLPELHLVAETQPTGFNLADKAGGSLGQTIDYLIVNKLTHGKLYSEDMTITDVARNNAIYGAVRGSVFEPVDNSSQNFWQQRSQNAVVGAAGYGIAGYFGVRMAQRGKLVDPQFYVPMSTFIFSNPADKRKTSIANVAASTETPGAHIELPHTETASASNTLADHAPDLSLNKPLSSPDFLRVEQNYIAVKSAPVDSGASPKQAFIPPERTGLNGQYDQSGLAKRVARMFEKDGMNPEHSVWVAQRGDSVVLEGKINGARALKELVELASSKQLARTVDSSRISLS